jgi:phosphoribosylanthranilate isomerase
VRTRVKICGITNLADALLAAELGAYAVGFVFFEGSRRSVSPEAVKEIVRHLPPFVVKVGVFVDEGLERTLAVKEFCSLDRIQVHAGDDALGEVRDAAAFAPGIMITAHRIRERSDVERAMRSPGFPLLDSHVQGNYGGTGTRFDWNMLKGVERPFILAGGIDPGNVREALQANPYAIDVASGVEKAPGLKDPERMRAFFAAIEGETGKVI